MAIAWTMGEPGGIGAEISLKAWQRLRETGCRFFLMHDLAWAQRAASEVGLPVRVIGHPGEADDVFADALPVLQMHVPGVITAGLPAVSHAPAVIESIRRGVGFVRCGQASALVTNPIQKSSLYAAGFAFPGYTEFLEHLAGPPFRSTIMIACPNPRVVPVTVHQSLRSAIAGLTTEKIVATALATEQAVARDFGVLRPRLAIAGLNPHAGEDGALGGEEIDIIEPAVRELVSRGLCATGPWPPDTLFTDRARRQYDVAICMYHDQALIPLKTLDVDGGVNVTLGLPFVRTSPDHGTALDLTGQGLADPGSLVAAIRMAADIVANRNATTGTRC